MSTLMGRNTCALALSLVLFAVARPAAAAEIVAVTVDAPPDFASTRSMQVLVLQELQEHGFATLDPPALRGPASPERGCELALEAGAVRLFALQLAPLGESVVAGLAEMNLATGAASFGTSLVIDTPADADRAFDRLVAAVLEGVPVDETARVSTVTLHEGRPFAKRPGEFLWGFSVMTAIGLQSGLDGGPAATYGGSLHFLYEIEHALFGGRLGAAGSADGGGLADVSVVGYWLPFDGDISPYVGGGLGFSFSAFHGEGDFGGHATVSAGVEFFRLHSARMLVGLDVLFPFYSIRRSCEDCVWDEGDDPFEQKVWTPALLLNVGVLF